MFATRLRSTAGFLFALTFLIAAITTLSRSSSRTSQQGHASPPAEQDRTSPLPQSPELMVLGAWSGQWTTHGKLYDTPLSHAGEITITMTCGWASYGGYMICDHIFTGPSGKRNDLTIYTYNDADKSYKFCGYDRSGTPRTTPLTIEGNVWSYDTDEEKDGKKIHIKTINDFSKPGIVTWNTKYTDDGGAHWTLMNEGVDTRTE
jgi:hypothetical protein